MNSGTYLVTKGGDIVASHLFEGREFRKKRRDFALTDIQDLKDEVGFIVELAGNWKTYESKVEHYQALLDRDYIILGRLQKYGPEVAQAARDTLHWCMLVASDEKNRSHERHETKKELRQKHSEFLSACDRYLDALV